MAHSFQLTIASASENIFSGEAQSITFPGTGGEFTVLAHHEPLVSTLKEGQLTIEAAGEKRRIAITRGGLVEIAHNRVTVLV